MKTDMKNRIIIALMLLGSTVAIAQPKGEFKGQKMDFQAIENEKIAFLTEHMNLSPEEGQVFWPVYNKVEKQIKEALKNQRTAFWNLSKALKDGKYDKALLDAYLDAKQAAAEDLHAKYAGEYIKAVGAEKYARFLVSQEIFRNKQIRQLRQGPVYDLHHKPGNFPGPQRDSSFRHRQTNDGQLHNKTK